jgi:hypothetical protein
MEPANNNTAAGNAASAKKRGQSRGVALVVTLTLLALLSAASLAMVLTVSSDTLINGYYRNYRGSFYAADSGVNIVTETFKNAILSAGVQGSTPPMVGIPASVTTSYAPYQAGYYSIGDSGSWGGQFEMIANPGGTAVITGPTGNTTGTPNPSDPSNPTDLMYSFVYTYTVTVQGKSTSGEAEQITEVGNITYGSTSGSGAAGAPPSFSKWGAFITNFAACQGPLAPGTMTGPFFTDGQWNFGNYSSPGYTFTDSVGQQNAQVSWFNSSGNCTNAATVPHGINSPTFPSGGIQLNQGAVTPPTNAYNQEQAVLDGKGTAPCSTNPCTSGATAPSQATMASELKTAAGTSYPTTGTPTSGVYFPTYTTGTNLAGQTCTTSTPCYGSWNSTSVPPGPGAGGGFLVEGNATITLAATTTGGNPTQTYTIVNNGVTTTIVVNNTAGTTTVTSGGNTTTMQGVPEQLDPNTGAVITQTDPSGNTVNPTMIYVDGSITGMSGTVQNNVGITVSAATSVSITGDVTYASQPVSIPADTLVSTTNAGVLGIYTPGNINLYANSSGSNSGNLTVDASLAAISGGSSGYATPGSGGINTLTIMGGRSEDSAHSVNLNAGNTYYDRRFAGNFGPPWFPTATPQAGSPAIASSESVTVARTSWQEDNRY